MGDIFVVGLCFDYFLDKFEIFGVVGYDVDVVVGILVFGFI